MGVKAKPGSGEVPPPDYGELHRHHRSDDVRRKHGARVALGKMFEHFAPQSVVDFGCGLGIWLEVAQELGVAEVHGVEGTWLDKSLLSIDPGAVSHGDLAKPVTLGRRFDLALSIEVAEHLPETSAEIFVATLTGHADVVMFSAAIPFQGGVGHVNEQWPTYWAEKFRHHGYVPVDFIRAQIWADKSIKWPLRQNLLVFASRKLVAPGAALAGLYHRVKDLMPLDLPHPELYLHHARRSDSKAKL